VNALHRIRRSVQSIRGLVGLWTLFRLGLSCLLLSAPVAHANHTTTPGYWNEHGTNDIPCNGFASLSAYAECLRVAAGQAFACGPQKWDFQFAVDKPTQIGAAEYQARVSIWEWHSPSCNFQQWRTSRTVRIVSPSCGSEVFNPVTGDCTPLPPDCPSSSDCAVPQRPADCPCDFVTGIKTERQISFTKTR
jgi:hypothetical protein